MEDRASGIINIAPDWSKGELKRLGEALAADNATPEDHDKYTDVMLWHNELAADVAAVLYTNGWRSCSSDLFDITARPKTIDTLVQKLQRERKLTLDEVQDLAGVRIDADIDLDTQTALANEIATHFGERSRVRDLRENPHSGYRAVHVWLRLPAGRVEVQIRTVLQSEWANTYERLGDRFGRGIRYDETPETEIARKMVARMHRMSEALARNEQSKAEMVKIEQELIGLHNQVEALPRRAKWLYPIRHRTTVAQLKRVTKNARKNEARRDGYQAEYVEMLREMRSMLDSDGS